MYQIVFVLSSKTYSENVNRPTALHITIRPQKQVNYNQKGNKYLHSPGVGLRSIV